MSSLFSKWHCMACKCCTMLSAAAFLLLGGVYMYLSLCSVPCHHADVKMALCMSV